MLNGCDISKWQKDVPDNMDFVICRAAYGKTIDSKFYSHMDKLKNKLVGAYLYAKTNEDPIECADVFIDIVNKCEQFGRTMILALDIEGTDAKRCNAVNWCSTWIKRVIEKTGIKPVLYIQSSMTNKFSELSKLDCGLWLAHWTSYSKIKHRGWKNWCLWQYSDSNGKLDLDKFNGTKEQYLKYCKGN